MVDLAGLDLNLLRVFAAVMRERSVTRAGEQIAMSQPAVSAALNRLRYALDDQLFVRRGNDMVPTPRAEELAGPVQDALNQLQAALQGRRSFDPARAERTYTLLGSDFFSLLLLPVMARRLSGRAPGIRVRMLDVSRIDVARQLQDDAVDVVLEGPMELPDWVSREVLFRSHFAIVARPDLAALREAGVRPGDAFPLEAFCALPHALRTVEGGMTGFTDEALAAIGRTRRVTMAMPHFHGVLLSVARSGMIAAVPRRFAQAFAPALGLALYEPPIALPSPDIQMVWHSRHDRNPAHRWLRAEIVAAMGEIGD